VFIIILTSFCCGLGVYRWPFCFSLYLKRKPCQLFRKRVEKEKFLEKNVARTQKLPFLNEFRQFLDFEKRFPE